MKVLAVKQPWASLITEGKKTIEVRSRPTNIREKIAIYATRSAWDKGCENINILPENHTYPSGAIIATAEISACFEFEYARHFKGYNRNHRVLDAHPFFTGAGNYAWQLINVTKLETPIPFKMPKGCVVWANYEGEL